MSDIFILAPDPTGACCDCSARMNVCDECTPSPCICALTLPIFQATSHPLANLAAAQSQISSYSIDCLLLNFPYSVGSTCTIDTSTINTLSSTAVSNTSTITVDGITYWIATTTNYISINVNAGSTVDFQYTITAASGGAPAGSNSRATVYIWHCDSDSSIESAITWDNETDENLLDDLNFGSGSNSGTFHWTFADGGQYTVLLTASNAVQGSSATLTTTYNVTADDVLTFNPVIALYTNPSDPTTPLELEACPRTEIPFGTEWGGNPYSDATTAQSRLDNNVIGCLAYFYDLYSPSSTYTSRTATGGSSISLSSSNTGHEQVIVLTGFVANAGDTITINYVSTSDVAATGVSALFASVVIYDSHGTLVYSNSNSTNSASTLSGSFSFVVPVIAPVAGKLYFYGATGGGGPGTTSNSMSWDISSSGTMVPNSVQALYTNGTNCPSRLDCTP